MYVSTYVLHSYVHTYICRYVRKGTILMYGRCMYVRMLLQSGAQLAVLMLSAHTYIHMYIHTYSVTTFPSKNAHTHAPSDNDSMLPTE